MDAILLPTLIAVTVSLFVMGLVQVLASSSRTSRKKLNRRLSIEDRGAAAAAAGPAKSITLQMEVKGLPPSLARLSLVQAVNRRLLQAFPDASVGKFLSLCLGVAVGVGAISLLVTASPLAGAAGAVVGGYVPFFYLGVKRSRRQRDIALQLPEGLDFLTRVLRAGHSLSTGLQMMGDELPKPLCEEFRRAYDQHSLGQSLEGSLKDAAARIESPDFAFFITAVLIQRQTGGDLSEVLKNISAMIRGRVRLAQSVKAKTAEGRFTGYILVAFPAIMFCLSYVLNPGYAGVLITTSTGKMLLGTSFGLMMLGLFCIRKITTVKV